MLKAKQCNLWSPSCTKYLCSYDYAVAKDDIHMNYTYRVGIHHYKVAMVRSYTMSHLLELLEVI